MTVSIEHAWTAAGIAAALPWLVDGARTSNTAASFDGASLEVALHTAAAALDVEVTAVTCPPNRIADAVASLAPIVIAVPDADARPNARALFVVRATRRRAVVSTPDGRRLRLDMNDLVQAFASPSVDGLDPLDVLTSKLGRRSERVGAALRRQRGAARPLLIGWTVERSRRVAGRGEFDVRQCVPLALTHLLQFGVWIASWVALVGLLSGVGERAQMTIVWVALLATALLLLPVESSLEQSLAARVGIAVKRRLFTDALDADKRQVGALGLGRMIAQSLETHHLDSMAARGSVRVVLATLDLLLVFVAYGLAIGVDALLVLFALVVAHGAYCARNYYAQAKRFLADNIAVTSVHTEQLVGHRTRKAFVAADHWNDEEDHSIARYHEAGRRFDAAHRHIARIPRMWTLLALFVVITTLYRGYGGDAAIATVAMIGFVIVTSAALQSIVTGSSEAIRAWLSYQQLDAFDPDPTLQQDRGLGVRPDADGEFVCRGVSYTYPGALQPVLENVDLAIAPRQRLLMTGQSGSGKSTMAAVMSGRTQQDSGVVLSGGVDRHIVGLRQWRRLVCYVPQAAANHVLTETFAFNLLLGRQWPPTPNDLDDALRVARALGLDGLLERMPAGLMQMVGEGGWTLSQGERARLFIARGILQRARLLIADEVLSPLDAGNALKTLDALEQHDGRLLLIAHS